MSTDRSATQPIPATMPDEKKEKQPELSSEFEDDPFLTDPWLRATAYANRVGRLLGGLTRYTAYTSDVGEAFRPVVPVNVVRFAYACSWTYVLSDVAFQVKWARDKNQDYVRAGLHAATFQTFGSMLFPAMIIHTVVHQSEKALPKLGITNRWGPVGLGLAVVPFLPFICDHPVEYATDKAFDHFWPTKEGGHHHSKHD